MHYTFESRQRTEDATDRAHDHLAAAARRDCSGEDIAAALRVLDAMADDRAVKELAQHMTYDGSGNPITRTREQQLAQSTWSEANELSYRLRSVSYALRGDVQEA